MRKYINTKLQVSNILEPITTVTIYNLHLNDGMATEREVGKEVEMADMRILTFMCLIVTGKYLTVVGWFLPSDPD